MSLKKVSIIGKPNVGKSQLFNRLIGEKHSIVLNQPGITRDRITQKVDWLNFEFLLTDTGGYTKEDHSFQEEINFQTEIAIKDSDLILLLVSAKDDLDIEDFYLAKLLKKKKVKNILVVVNKCENIDTDSISYQYKKLGLGDAIFISAEHGINTGKLLDFIVHKLSIDQKNLEINDSKLKIAVIGKPNVGKSSLCNFLLKEERVIVSPISGTTRDAVDLEFFFNKKSYIIIDTAGIRRNSQIYRNESERYSVLRAKKAIERADQVLLLLDISEPLTELDERIGGLIYKANIPTVLVGNKWDLISNKSDFECKNIEKTIKNKFPFLKWAPIVFISAKHGNKISHIFKKIELINREKSRKISRTNLQLFLYKIHSLFSIPTVKGEKIKLFTIKQILGQIPTFLIICSNVDLLHFSYSRLIENQLRKQFGYRYTPITVIYKTKEFSN